jgi:hypothetical protein
MKFKLLLALFLINAGAAFAQVDTINTKNLKLNIAALKEGKSSYAVYFEDSLGGRLSSAALWDRKISFSKDAAGKKIYHFGWDWYQKDSLLAHVEATGELPSLKPISHYANYKKRGKFTYIFNGNVVTVPDSSKHTKKDSTFQVVMNPPAFEFPMDLEIFPLLPFKKVGQQFAIAFYEPGTPKSDYYLLTVTGKEDLQLNNSVKVSCWLLKINYGRGSYATFWIADKSREVLKMKEYFRGRYRIKVKLY